MLLLLFLLCNVAVGKVGPADVVVPAAVRLRALLLFITFSLKVKKK